FTTTIVVQSCLSKHWSSNIFVRHFHTGNRSTPTERYIAGFIRNGRVVRSPAWTNSAYRSVLRFWRSDAVQVLLLPRWQGKGSQFALLIACMRWPRGREP